jgi:hypothetical protein
MNPQIFGALMDKPMPRARWKCSIPRTDEKEPPGKLMTIVAQPEQRRRQISLQGIDHDWIRHQELSRECLDREMVTVTTAWSCV